MVVKLTNAHLAARDRAQAALLRYEAANRAASVAEADLIRGLRPASADDLVAVEKLKQEAAAAMLEYRRLLRIFSELVVHGKIPDEK
jgi:hypothetical protein